MDVTPVGQKSENNLGALLLWVVGVTVTTPMGGSHIATEKRGAVDRIVARSQGQGVVKQIRTVILLCIFKANYSKGTWLSINHINVKAPDHHSF